MSTPSNGRTVVHVVTSPAEPAVVFAHLDDARAFAAAAGHDREPQSATVADGALAQALIASVRNR